MRLALPDKVKFPATAILLEAFQDGAPVDSLAGVTTPLSIVQVVPPPLTVISPLSPSRTLPTTTETSTFSNLPEVASY